MLSIIMPAESTALAYGTYQSGSTGNDISWPPSNCSADPPKNSAFGIVGITGGLNFTQNPCLQSEAKRFDNLSVYINTGYPGPEAAKKYASDTVVCPYVIRQCLAYDYGFAAAQYALLYAASQGVYAGRWWLDVETENSWTGHADQNRASLQGAMDAITQETMLRPTLGIYSTPYQWMQITDGWKINVPNWVGTGSTMREDAVRACNGNDFTGGGTQLTQYIRDIDHDYTC